MATTLRACTAFKSNGQYSVISTRIPQTAQASDHVRRFVGGSSFAAAGLIASGVITLSTGIVFARWLGPRDFGTYSLVVAAVTLIGGFGAVGMDTAVPRFVSYYLGVGSLELVRPVIRFGISCAVAASSCLALGTFWLLTARNPLPEKLVPLRTVAIFIAAVIPIFAMLLVLQQAILGLGCIKTRIVIEKFMQPVLRLSMPFALVLVAGGRFSAAVAGVVLATLIGLIVAGLALKYATIGFRGGSKPSVRELRQWSGYALPFAFQSLQQFVSNGLGIDIFLVGLLASLSDSGIYAAAFRFTPLLTLVRSAMDYAFGPKVAALYGKSDLQSIDVLYKTSSTIGLMFTLPFGIIFVLFSWQIMTTFFGVSYAQGAVALAWLVLGCVVDSATGCNTTLLAMVGKPWLVLINGLVGGTLAVLLCCFLIPRLGISGAAIAVTAARACANLLATLQLWKFLALQPFSSRTLRLILPAGVTALAGLAIRSQLSLIHFPGIVTLALVGSVLLGLYITGIRLVGLLRLQLT